MVFMAGLQEENSSQKKDIVAQQHFTKDCENKPESKKRENEKTLGSFTAIYLWAQIIVNQLSSCPSDDPPVSSNGKRNFKRPKYINLLS